MIRQTSDIASKYVGETEQNMARMFEEAAAESAVLLLDEADSFLRSRRMAERTTRSPRSTRCCRAWNALRASSSAPRISSKTWTKRRCGASPSRCASTP
jgi:SpoVK/Ycf46/Vps4 family AAA+-type ATPase